MEAGITKDRPGGEGSHTSMKTIKTEGTVEEVGRAFGGATNATEFDDLFGNDIHLITGGNDLVGDGIMSTTGTQG